MKLKKINPVFLKIIGFFSSIRVHNIFLICVAQYLAAIFVLSKGEAISVLFDDKLFALVLAGAFAIASGYIINGFYDQDKDLINNPLKVKIDRLVGQNTKLNLYFVLNFLCVIIASYVSFRAVIFYSLYIFGLWFYSHKLKKKWFLSNFVSAMLSVVPFFAVFIYYRNFEKVIFLHAIYVFLLILIRSFIKDLGNLKGDFVFNYSTIPVKYGENMAKKSVFFFVLLTFIPMFFLTLTYDVGLMKYYFWGTSFALLFLCFLLFFKNQKWYYILFNNVLKIILFLGVFSVCFIKIKY